MDTLFCTSSKYVGVGWIPLALTFWLDGSFSHLGNRKFWKRVTSDPVSIKAVVVISNSYTVTSIYVRIGKWSSFIFYWELLYCSYQLKWFG